MEALLKRHPHSTPKWEVKEQMSKKNGSRAKIYLINGDTFIGEWKNDLKNGNGTYFYKKSGNVYQGNFVDDKREGYGTLSVKKVIKAQEKSTDANSFINGLKNIIKNESEENTLRKLYAGEWVNDKRHGTGTCFYENSDLYHGQWEEDMKQGWGQMKYADGSLYQGEFWKEQRHGQGILLLANGDRYEGMWFNDLKEGPGKFIYKQKRQIYEGEWSLGMPKCGFLRDLPMVPGATPGQFQLPKIELFNPELVIEMQKDLIFEERGKRLLLE